MPTRGMKSLVRRVESMKDDLDSKPERAVSNGAARTVATAKENVVAEDAVASTELFRGIQYRKRGNRVVIESTAPHSGYVEFGTGQHHVLNPWTRRYKAPDFSPQLVGALTEWAVEKDAINRAYDIRDPVSFATAVGLRISGNVDGEMSGTEAQPFMRPAWNSNKPLLLQEVQKAVRDSV